VNPIYSSIEIVEVFAPERGECEVCATAEAAFDEAQSRLTVSLDSFLRPVNLRLKESRESADWLPPKQTVREKVSREEAVALAQDIFHRWVGKVRQSIPSLVNP
jgi:hypothetical protein